MHVLLQYNLTACQTLQLSLLGYWYLTNTTTTSFCNMKLFPMLWFSNLLVQLIFLFGNLYVFVLVNNCKFIKQNFWDTNCTVMDLGGGGSYVSRRLWNDKSCVNITWHSFELLLLHPLTWGMQRSPFRDRVVYQDGGTLQDQGFYTVCMAFESSEI